VQEIATQIGQTIRYSLAGWPRTIRLCVIMIVVVAIYVLLIRH
jgi:hypothetical protein